MIREYRRTNIFVIDEDLWKWSKYKADLLGFKSVSKYLFELIELDKEKNILHVEAQQEEYKFAKER